MTDQPQNFLSLRKSRPKQRGQSAAEREQDERDELARHRSILLHLAEQDGRCIPGDHIIAEVRSGERLSRRPEFSGWLQRLKEYPPPDGGTLYCMDVDRISRGVASERGLIQEIIAAANIKIRTPSGITDLGDPEAVLLYEVKGSLARHELQRYRRRVEATKREMTRLGQLPTGAPAWGYRWDKNLQQPIPDPQRFPILVAWCQDVFRLSVQRLADRDGVYPTLVYRTLRNPMIAGYPARRWKAVDGKLQRLPRGEWVWPEQQGTYPAACTREHWEAMQVALNQRFTRLLRTGQEPDGWCRNLVRFEGYAQPVRLGCIWRHVLVYEIDPARTDRYLYIRRDLVHQAVEAELRRLAGNATAVCQAARRLVAAAAAASELGTSGQAEHLRAELAAARQELVRLMSRWATAEEPEEQTALRAAEEAVKQQISRLKRDLAASERQPEPQAGLEEILPVLPDLLADWESRWEETPMTMRRWLAESVIEAVAVRVTLVGPRQHARREVVAVRLRPWLAGV